MPPLPPPPPASYASEMKKKVETAVKRKCRLYFDLGYPLIGKQVINNLRLS